MLLLASRYISVSKRSFTWLDIPTQHNCREFIFSTVQVENKLLGEELTLPASVVI